MSLMKSITPDRCQRELQEAGSSDFGFAFGDLARFRVSIFKQRGNISMVLRQIPNDKLTPEQLGLAQSVVEMVQRPRGIGAGHRSDRFGQKYHFGQLDQLPQRGHTITTSSRLRIRSSSTTITSSRRSISAKSGWMCQALRRRFERALRQDPDVILVGELRDLETIQAAISAAETGHVVFGHCIPTALKAR